MNLISSIVVAGIFSVSFCQAQNMNVQSANNALKHNEIAKAKEVIDLAYANPSTSNDTKMWYYRGLTYLAVYRDTGELGRSEPDAAEKATISFINVIKADGGHYSSSAFTVDDAYGQVWIAGVALNNKANAAYLNGDYERAIRFYNLILDVIPLDKDNNLKRNNITPDLVNLNLYKTADKAKDYDKAKTYLQKLIDNKYNDPMVYIYASNIYLAEKDTIKALTYISTGRSRFEENQPLIDEEIRIYIAQKKTDILTEKLTTAIEANPDNEKLYYIRGILYAKAQMIDKAREDYKKVLEINPEHFEANYNVGAMYYNEAGDKLNSISNIRNQDEYAKAKEKCEQIFNQSQPYFEKAHQVNPKDKDATSLLMKLYFRQNKMDKYNELKAQMEAEGK